ncbi:MAG: transporter substrate-binding domain-containing protein, partial [Syntrophomonas sp.]
MKKRFVLGIALLLIFAVFVGGCGTSTKANNSSAPTAQQSTLEKVLKTKQLTVACALTFPPFGSKDASGKPEGYDVDLANELAKSLGAKLTIIDVTSANRIPYLETGKADIVMADFTRTLERAQKIDFTDPYVVAGETLLVKKGSGIKGITDLKGKTVAVVKGGTGSIAVR